ncbi:ABC transporter ATP-binding protein [Chloroflexota bacterium]
MHHGGGGGPHGGGGGPHGFGGGGYGHHIDDEEGQGRVYDSKIVRRLPKYLAPVKAWLAVGAFGMVLRSLASLAAPYLIAVGTDNYIQTGDLGGLDILVLLFIGAALLVWAGQYLETRFVAYAGQAVLLRLRTEMFDHLQKLSMSFFDCSQVGMLMSRVQNDVQQLQQLVTAGILNLLTNVLTLIGIAVVMLTMNTRLALLTLTVVPVLGLVVFIWQKYARRAFFRVRRAIAVVNAQLQESISGVRVIQSLSREDVNIEQFDNINRANLDANIQATRLTAMMMPVAEILNAVATSMVIVFGGYMVLSGEMGIGVLLGFVLYIQRFFHPVIELTMEYTELQRALASGTRIFELLDIKPEITDSPDAVEIPPAKGEIQFNQVSFSYKPGLEVLHGIDFSVNPGETVAIVGQTGAGKSSIANLITRFYDIVKGEVTVDGHDVRSVTRNSLRNQIGIVPQDPFLFSGSIEDNIRYGCSEASHEEVVRVAKAVGAHNFIMRLESGYDTQVGERGGNLSAGQRQFICLARAILPNPPILILDEATSNVDTNTERLMQKSLSRLSEKRTCLIIAHRLSTITGADRIIVLDKGSIIEAGSHRELIAKKGLYSQMIQVLSSPDFNQAGN